MRKLSFVPSDSGLGKNHVCKFIGCGRNDKFNYVVMQLQVSWSEGEVGVASPG